MALKEAGINLVAKGYAAYMQALANINKAQKAAFDDRSVKQYNAAVEQTTQTSKAWGRVVSRAATDSKKLSGSVAGLSEGMNRFGSATGTASGGIGGLISKLSGLMGASGGAAGGMGGLVSTFVKTAGSAGAAAAAVGVLAGGLLLVVGAVKKAITAFTSFIKVSGQVAARNETLAVVLAGVGKQAGYTATQIDAATKALEKKGITTKEARQTLINLASANVEWADAIKLAAVAQNAAVRADLNSSETMGRLIWGLQTKNKVILKTLGLTVDWAKAEQEMADSLGVSVDQLTEYDIAQAKVNAIVESGVPIQNAYNDAMATTAKRMGSLDRHIEQAQAAWGRLMLPIMDIRVELRTRFWKAMKDAGEGLADLSEIGDAVVDSMWTLADSLGAVVNEAIKLQETETVFIRLGGAIHDLSGIALVGLAHVAAAVLTVGVTFELVAKTVDKLWEALAEGNASALKDIQSGWEKFSTADTFDKLLEASLETLKTKLPRLMTPFRQLRKEIAEDLDRGTEALQAYLRELAKEQTILENNMRALQAMESVILQYERARGSAYENYLADLANMSRNAAEEEMQISEDLADKLAQIEERAADRRAKIRAKYAWNQEKLELNYQKKLQQNYERYLLRKQQSQRRFALSERRLAAAGDVLGLIMAREDEALRLKEEEENRDIGLRHDQQNYEARLAEMEAAFKEQMRLLTEETEKQRRAAIDAATQQRLDMQRGLLDQRQLIEDNYQKQLQMAEQAKDDSLIQLGRRYNAENKINKEGLADIIALINDSYGADGFADSIMTGYVERSEEALAILFNSQRDRLLELQALQEYVAEFREIPTGSASEGALSFLEGMGTPTRIPRRMGGEDIVTGPATFVVEPGVTEYHSFIPMPVSQAINVQHSGSFGLTGAGNASPGSVDMALERMIDGFDLALKRLRRR